MQSRFESSLGEDAVSISNCIEDSISPECMLSDADGCQAQYKVKVSSKPENVVDPHGSLGRNYVQVDPSYLKTLGQVHSSWIFGAIAEFVDNSRDAKATKSVTFSIVIYFLIVHEIFLLYFVVTLDLSFCDV